MKSKPNIPIITIDGPSGTGKGTLCHKLAKHLNWHYLDSGVLYRALAYQIQLNNIALTDTHTIVTIAHDLTLHFHADPAGAHAVILNGQTIDVELRTESCSQMASKIAAIPEIRTALTQKQRAFAQMPGLITDGRDMGTVIFPDACLKIYLDAKQAERAKRRYQQLCHRGISITIEEVMHELAERDNRDCARQHAPLKAAADAIYIDTTNLSSEQLVAMVLQIIHNS